MSFIAGYLLGLEEGSGANIQPLTITENKEYNAADYGCDGFNPVVVNVPDRYDEGYEAAKAKIIPLTITHGGTYYAEHYGALGYNPVNAEILNRLENYLNKIIQTADDFNETGNGTMDDVNPDDLGTVTGSLFGARTVKEVHIQCPDTGYTIVVGCKYNKAPPQYMAFGHIIDPEGNIIQPWTGGLTPGFNARVVRTEWAYGALIIYYYSERSDGTHGEIRYHQKSYSKKYTGNGNKNVTIVG